MITEQVTQERARQQRAMICGTFQRRADSMFDLIDALASDTQARSPVELSLSPFYRRQYASIYKLEFRQSVKRRADAQPNQDL